MTILVGTTASRFPENFKQKVGREAKALNYKQLLHSSPRGGPEGGKSPSVSLQSKHPVRLQTAPAFFPQGFQHEGAQSTLGDLSGGTARAASSFPSPCAPPALLVPWKEGKSRAVQVSYTRRSRPCTHVVEELPPCLLGQGFTKSSAKLIPPKK